MTRPAWAAVAAVASPPAAPTRAATDSDAGVCSASLSAPLPAVLSGPAALLDALPDPAWLVHPGADRVLHANAVARALLGDAVQPGQPASALLQSAEDAAWWAAAAAGEMQPLQSDTVVGLPDGRTRQVSRSIRALAGEGGAQGLVLVTLRDRSDGHQADAERDAALAELRATLDSTSDGILVLDLQGGIRHFNRRFAELWDLPPALLTARHDAAITAWMHGQLLPAEGAGAPRTAGLERLQLASGRVLERASQPLLQGGRLQGRVHAFRDITERLAMARRVHELGRTDALTGLPNRAALVEHIARLAVPAHGRPVRGALGAGFALLLVDLDRFGDLNQHLGQDAGDRALCEVALRLQRALREPDLVARLGGDQFVVLARLGTPGGAGPVALHAGPPTTPHAAVESVASRVLEAVARPLALDGPGAVAGAVAGAGADAAAGRYTLTCSIGAALCPAHGGTADELLHRAEAALRSVKHSGRSHWRLHGGGSDGDRRRPLQLDQAMRQALVSNRFRLQYQPQVSLADGRIIGAEALLRWRDPALGEIAPSQFIPVAEDSGFIVAIGKWVLAEAVRQATLWAQRGHALPVAVNVSALQFQQRDFVEHVDSVLRVSGLPPSLLELELTESMLVRDPEEALERLQALAALGLRLSLDDFGTGYSVVGLLKDRRLPVRTLKIDRSFVKGLPEDARSAGIVRGMLEMARACDLQVLAEGVETVAQADFLRAAGCDHYQGWLCAPALDSLSFEKRLLAGPAPRGHAGGGATRPGLRLV